MRGIQSGSKVMKQENSEGISNGFTDDSFTLETTIINNMGGW